MQTDQAAGKWLGSVRLRFINNRVKHATTVGSLGNFSSENFRYGSLIKISDRSARCWISNLYATFVTIYDCVCFLIPTGIVFTSVKLVDYS